MKKPFLIGVAIGFVAVLAMGAQRADSPPAMRFGAVNVLASAPVAVPAQCNRRNSWAAFNLGPNTIYCGNDAGVTTTTGFPTPANSPLSVDIACSAGGVNQGINNTIVYCIAATADQTPPLNTRWLEVQ